MLHGNIKFSGTITSGATNNNHAASKYYVDTQISNLIGNAPDALDTLKELADNFADYEKTADINTALNNKVDTIGDQTINGNKTFSGDSEFNNINFTGTLTQNGVTFTSGGGSSSGSSEIFDATKQCKTNISC